MNVVKRVAICQLINMINLFKLFKNRFLFLRKNILFIHMNLKGLSLYLVLHAMSIIDESFTYFHGFDISHRIVSVDVIVKIVAVYTRIFTVIKTILYMYGNNFSPLNLYICVVRNHFSDRSQTHVHLMQKGGPQNFEF